MLITRKDPENKMDSSQSSIDEQALERTRSFGEEPKQPTNLPNAIQNALQTVDDAQSAAQKKGKGRNCKATALTSADVKYLFSGAPHFMLEKGHHNHWYPHVLFPWDSSLPIQDLWDRDVLRHESFTLSTLHAHLPVPKKMPFKGSSERSKNDGQQTSKQWENEHGVKRSSYDLGIFEVPNMLSANGKEPGAVGFRHFLELATADAVRYKQDVPSGESPDWHLLANVSLTEAFDTLSHLRDVYSQCNQEVVFDRHRLLREGPAAWKRIGLRDVRIKDIVERLEKLSNLRLEALKQNSTTSTGEEKKPGQNNTITILDRESTESLHKELYTKFLFPPPRGWGHHAHEELKSQIEVITRVLAVKGAWLNLSLPEWRLRVGQILWEMPPHADGDCMDCIKPFQESKTAKPSFPKTSSNLDNGLERKWLLLQLVLAGELLMRLDAIVHLAVLQHSKQISVAAQDIRELDKLRHGKVNWDILFFQRFSDNLSIKYLPRTGPHLIGQSDQQQQQKQQEETHDLTRHRSLLSKFGGISKHLRSNSISAHSPRESTSAHSSSTESAWDCIAISSRHPERQLEGLAMFATIIGWPGYETLEARIRSNVQQNEGNPMTTETVSSAYSVPVKNMASSRLFSKKETYTRNPCHQYLVLHEKKTKEQDGDTSLGGWLSRTWLTGLVMPGENISHLLMATLLENDPNAIRTLGTVANLYGGFSYGDQGCTWWSTKCIVGRVLAALERSKVCMGWVKTSITPVFDGSDEKKAPLKLTDTWFSIEGIQEPLQKNTRIRQGTKLSLESNPLGRGRVANDTFTLPLDDDEKKNQDVSIKLNELTLSRRDNPTVGEGASSESIKKIFLADRASLSFDITTTTTTTTTSSTTTESVIFPLRYNAIFISSYTCRPPRGSVEQTHEKIHHEFYQEHNSRHTHLPGHPLHKSYTYKHVSLQGLRPSTQPPIIHFITPPSSPASTPVPEKPSTETDTEMIVDEEPVWILDARRSRDKEVFARAWCAAVGVNALVGRVGRTCLACCVREARAVGVAVVIRVGSPSSQVSSKSVDISNR